MLRLAIFTSTFDEINGQALTYKNFLKWNEERGHTLTAIFTVATSNRVIYCKYTTVYFLRPILPSRLPFYRDFVIGIPRLKLIKKYLLEHKCNFALITDIAPHCVLAGYLVRKMNIPYACFYHTRFIDYATIYGKKFWGESLAKLFRFIVITVHKWVYSRARLIFTYSKLLSSDIQEFCNLPIYIIPGGADQTIFRPYELKFPQKRIIYVGRVAIEKNLEVLAKVHNKLREKGIELLWVGDGPYAEYLHHKYGIEFTGYVKYNELPRFLCKCDAFVFPSLTDAFGNVVVEALSVGLPAIVPKNTVASEIIKKSRAGIEFNGTSPSDLYKKILSIYETPRLWLRLHRNALNNNHNYSWDNTFTKMIKILAETVDRPEI